MTNGFTTTGIHIQKMDSYLKQYCKGINSSESIVNAAIPFSLFDTKGKIVDKKDVADGQISQDEFNAVSKEDYEKYCLELKTEILARTEQKIAELEKTKSEIRQKALESGVNDEKAIRKMENSAEHDISLEKELRSVNPPTYDVLKNSIEKNGPIKWGALVGAEMGAKIDSDLYDSNKDGLISEDENVDLYKANGNKPLSKDDILTYELDRRSKN